MKKPVNFETTSGSIAVTRRYPTLVGENDQVFSRAEPSGVFQQFIDRRMQKELLLKPEVVRMLAGTGTQCFAWKLTFYVHPGMRREIPVEPNVLPELVEYLHGLTVGVAPAGQLNKRLDDWCIVHTLGFGGRWETGKQVLAYLKAAHFAYTDVEKNVAEYGIKAID